MITTAPTGLGVGRGVSPGRVAAFCFAAKSCHTGGTDRPANRSLGQTITNPRPMMLSMGTSP